MILEVEKVKPFIATVFYIVELPDVADKMEVFLRGEKTRWGFLLRDDANVFTYGDGVVLDVSVKDGHTAACRWELPSEQFDHGSLA